MYSFFNLLSINNIFGTSNADDIFMFGATRVIFKNTVVTAPFNKALWSVWNANDTHTDNVLFAEYNSTGSGVSGATRPSFATVLSASQASAYSISSAVGGDYASWVDMSYFV